MKKISKMLVIAALYILTVNQMSGQTILNKVSEARRLELNKKEFVGRPLKEFLDNINLNIESAIPAPNKNLKEINRISFLFTPYNQYRKDNRDINNKPTRITVVFNQNWDLKGDRCTYNKSGCTDWTSADEKRLGDLIIYDIYVVGKN